jgi:small GTP-binding protein
MSEGDWTVLYRVVFIGLSGVGKTNLILTFHHGKYDLQTQTTMGVDFVSCTRYIEDEPIRFRLWDTGGQERFAAIQQQFFRNAHGVVFVFDLSDRHSFEKLPFWVQQYQESNHTQPCLLLLVGNKCDLVSERQVPEEAARKYAAELGASYVETSAKQGVNVQSSLDAFFADIHRFFSSRPAESMAVVPPNTFRLLPVKRNVVRGREEDRKCCPHG